MNIVLGSSSSFSFTFNGFHNSVSVASGFYTNGNSSSPSSPPFEFLQFQSSNFPIFGVSFLNQNLTLNGNYNQVETVVDASGVQRKIGGVIKLQGSGGGFRGLVVPYRSVSPFSLPFSVRDPVLGAVDASTVTPSPADNYVQVTYIPTPDLKIYYFGFSFSDGTNTAPLPAIGFLSPDISLPSFSPPAPGWLLPSPDRDIQIRTIDQDGRGRVIYTTEGNTVLDDNERVRTAILEAQQLIPSTPSIEILLPTSQTNAPALTSASVWILMIRSKP